MHLLIRVHHLSRVFVYQLHPLHGLTQKLQGRTKDIVAAYQGVEEIIRQLKSMRENMEDTYRCIYNHGCRNAEKTGC